MVFYNRIELEAFSEFYSSNRFACMVLTVSKVDQCRAPKAEATHSQINISSIWQSSGSWPRLHGLVFSPCGNPEDGDDSLRASTVRSAISQINPLRRTFFPRSRGTHAVNLRQIPSRTPGRLRDKAQSDLAYKTSTTQISPILCFAEFWARKAQRQECTCPGDPVQLGIQRRWRRRWTMAWNGMEWDW